MVELNRPNLSPVLIPPPYIHISQRCLTQCPAIPRFLAHSLDDLVSQVAGVELGDAAHDAVQQHAAGGLVDVLRCRHQPDAGVLEGAVDLHIVRPVPGQAI